MNKFSIIAGALALAFSSSAFAAGSVISSLNDVPAAQQVINFENENGNQISTIGSWSNIGLNFSADDQFTVGQYVADLGENGLWGGNGNHFLSFDKVGSMSLTINLGGLTTRGFAFDYSLYEADAAGSANLAVEAFDTNGAHIGNYSLSFGPAFGISTYNQFSTTGWVEDSASIASIRITGDGVVLDNFTVTTPVPEPEQYALLLAGLGLLGFAARRNQR